MIGNFGTPYERGYRKGMMGRVPIVHRYECDPNSGCWLWLLNVSSKGYGMGKSDVGEMYARRRKIFGLARSTLTEMRKT